MTEPQVWTLIGVFAAVMVGMPTLMTTFFTKRLDDGVAMLRSEIGRVSDKVDGLDRRMDQMEGWMDRLEHKVDGLDREVAALTRHARGAEE